MSNITFNFKDMFFYEIIIIFLTVFGLYYTLDSDISMQELQLKHNESRKFELNDNKINSINLYMFIGANNGTILSLHGSSNILKIMIEQTKIKISYEIESSTCERTAAVNVTISITEKNLKVKLSPNCNLIWENKDDNYTKFYVGPLFLPLSSHYIACVTQLYYGNTQSIKASTNQCSKTTKCGLVCGKNAECVILKHKSYALECRCTEPFYGKYCLCHPDSCTKFGQCIEETRTKSICKCSLQAFGDKCQHVTNYCRNGGSSLVIKNGINCTCTKGFKGSICSCPSDYCKNGGYCDPNSKRKCVCKQGYQGETCACTKNHCKKPKTCLEEGGKPKCICPGSLFGDNCLCNWNSCSNKGRCLNNGNQVKCDCINGYTGKTCKCPPGYCGKGKCKETQDKLTCICPVGRSGATCACSNTYCKNGGNCIENSYRLSCNCSSKYEGYKCLCPINHCGANAKCVVNKNKDTFRCDCNNGYEGKGCRCPVNYCLNGGKCIETKDGMKCKCKNPYFGPRCLCTKDYCGNRGKCTEILNTTHYQCKCKTNYFGHRCLCSRDFCQNGGTCVTDVYSKQPGCECKEEYSGPQCRCYLGYCHNGGICKSKLNSSAISCDCPNGYEGPRCMCPVGYCMNGGVCKVNNNLGIYCQCKRFYSGPRCVCKRHMCSGNGMCKLGHGVRSFQCDCSLDSYGADCEKKYPIYQMVITFCKQYYIIIAFFFIGIVSGLVSGILFLKYAVTRSNKQIMSYEMTFESSEVSNEITGYH